MFTILIPDRIDNADIEKEYFGSDFQIIVKNANQSSEISDKIWEKTDGILAWHDIDYNRKLISKLKNCKAIVRVGVGYDNVDLDAASDSEIIVCNVPDYGTEDVADHTWGLILSLERGIVKFNRSVMNSGPWDWKLGKDLERIQGKKLGIIGLGRIGKAMANRAKAFGMDVYFFDPYLTKGVEESLIIKREKKLDSLLSKSDFITIHTPLTEETRGMVNRGFFDKMKTGASLYNTARGEIIVLDDLYKALKANQIKWVGFDVLEKEPIDYNHPLIKSWTSNEEWIRDRLVITPHSAFYNQQSYDEMRLKASQELKRILEGENPQNQVY